MQRKLLHEALQVGKAYNVHYKMRGLIPPVSLRLRYAFFEKTVIALLKRTWGLRTLTFPYCRSCHSTGSGRVRPFGRHQYGGGYGLTESTATVSCDRGRATQDDRSVGRLIGGLQLKFGEDNEILLRGTSITKGYYRKDEATRAAIDEDGWFHTGDAGYLKNGELFLTDRIKDLFKTSNGKYMLRR